MADANPELQDAHDDWNRFFERMLAARIHYMFAILIGLFVLMGFLGSTHDPYLVKLKKRKAHKSMTQMEREDVRGWNARVNRRNPIIENEFDRHEAWWKNGGKEQKISRQNFFKTLAAILAISWLTLLIFGCALKHILSYVQDVFGAFIGRIISPVVILAIVHVLAEMMKSALSKQPPTEQGLSRVFYELFNQILTPLCDAITNFSSLVVNKEVFTWGFLLILLYVIATEFMKSRNASTK